MTNRQAGSSTDSAGILNPKFWKILKIQNSEKALCRLQHNYVYYV